MHHILEHPAKEHLLSGVDARLKLITAVCLLVMVLSYRGFLFPALVFVLSLLLCRQMRVPLKSFLLRFSEPAFVAVVLVLLKTFFSGSEAAFSKAGFLEGLMIAARIIGAVSVIAALGFSAPFTEIISGLSWFRVPKGFTEVLMFAYRYVFLLLDDAMVIYSAQKNRLGYAGVRRGLGSFGILAGSLTLRAFENSQKTATAMEQRGYDGSMPRAMHKPFRVSELMASAALILIMAVIWKS